MTGKIFRSCFLVGLAVMILCTGLFVAVMASQYEEEVYQQLQEELAYVKHGMEESGQAYLTGLRTTQRLTWVDTDGTVLYDSVADPATMENHGDRAEIRQAMEEGSGQGKHLSNTLLQKNLYYAARLSDGTVLRISCVETTVGALILGFSSRCCGFWCWPSSCRGFWPPGCLGRLPNPSTAWIWKTPGWMRPMRSSFPWSAA